MNDDMFDRLVASVREGGDILQGRASASRTYVIEGPDISDQQASAQRGRSVKKTEFISRVARDAGVSQDEAAKVVNAALQIIVNALKDGDRVTLTGFGTFEVRKRAARMGVHPRTKQKVRIEASRRPAFLPGQGLRTSLEMRPISPKPK
jgi:DNA-binding protein HU-beta